MGGRGRSAPKPLTPEEIEANRKKGMQAKALGAAGKGSGTSAYQTTGRSALTISSSGGGGGGTGYTTSGRSVGINIP